MPEIAEVETVRNTLKKRILGKKIKKVDVYYEPMLLDNKDYFCSSLINQSFAYFLLRFESNPLFH